MVLNCRVNAPDSAGVVLQAGQEAIVFGMGANKEPDYLIVFAHSDCSLRIRYPP
jgi:hypothetical protein